MSNIEILSNADTVRLQFFFIKNHFKGKEKDYPMQRNFGLTYSVTWFFTSSPPQLESLI